MWYNKRMENIGRSGLEEKLTEYGEKAEEISREYMDKFLSAPEEQRAEYRKEVAARRMALSKATFEALSDEELSELRLKRIESIEGEGIEHGLSVEQKDLNFVDKKFHKSKEYRAYQEREWQRLNKENPGVFGEVDDDAAGEVLLNVLLKIPEEDYRRLAELEEAEGLEVADRSQVESLREYLGIEGPVTLVYKDGPSVAETVSLEQGKDGLQEDEQDGLQGDDRDGLQGEIDYENRTLMLFNRFFNRENRAVARETIAHEMWHFYQREQAEKGTERGKLYQANFEHLFPSDGDEVMYKKQLVEHEAYAFNEVYGSLYRKHGLGEEKSS